MSSNRILIEIEFARLDDFIQAVKTCKARAFFYSVDGYALMGRNLILKAVSDGDLVEIFIYRQNNVVVTSVLEYIRRSLPGVDVIEGVVRTPK